MWASNEGLQLTDGLVDYRCMKATTCGVRTGYYQTSETAPSATMGPLQACFFPFQVYALHSMQHLSPLHSVCQPCL